MKRLQVIIPVVLAVSAAVLVGTGFSAVVQEDVSPTSAAFHVSFLDWHTWTVYGMPGKVPLGIRFLPLVIIVGAFVVGAVVGMGVSGVFRHRKGQT
jgi:hypothetical protein